MEINIKEIVLQGINQTTAFHTNAENTLEIVETICAFANTNGGVLYIGIRKNGKIVGIEPSETFSLLNQALDCCKPTVDYTIDFIQLEHKILGIVEIKVSNDLHKIEFEDEWVPFIRINDINVVATTVLKKFLEIKKAKKQPIEIEESEKEVIIQTISNLKSCSFTQLTKHISIKRERLEQILATMLENSTISFSYSNETLFYELNEL